MEKRLKIQWMHCASCAQIISDKVTQLSWVSSCEVNFATKKTSIIYNQNKISLQKIAQEIHKYGYTLVIPEEDQDNWTENQEQKDFDWAWKKVLISIPLAGIAIMGMLYMIGIDYQWRSKNLIIHHFFMGVLPIFATIMLTVVGWKYVLAIGKYIRYGVANMDTLVGIGTVSAFIYSFVSKTFYDVWPDILSKQVFFEAVIVVIGFIEIWRYLEAKIMSKTGNAIKALLWLQAKEALLQRDGKEILVALSEVKVWDIMIVKPGEKIPLDGSIVSGNAHIDESMITGESLPVFRKEGDIVVGSTIVSDSVLYIKASAVWSDSYLSKIIAIVEHAQNSKPKIQKIADNIMKYFIPSVLVIALLAGIFRLFFWKTFFPQINNINFALMSFVGVLVIACPCGLGLATPMAIITGVGHGARKGILAKNAEWLLKLRKSTIIVFDKTGTITEWKPELVEISSEDQTINHLSILASLENLSSHPIAHAITQYAQKNNIWLQEVSDFKNLEGIGVSGIIGKDRYIVVKPSHADTIGVKYNKSIINTWTSQGKTPLLLIKDNLVVGSYAVADQIKKTSKNAIEDLKSQWIIPIMLTGDHKNTAEYIAWCVGIERIYAEVKPEEKAQIVSKLKKEWVVTMVGDGINDAPALATADIGVAMSTWTDVAIESAEITLLHGDLNKLVKAIRISKLTQSAIIQNLVWAFGFNIIGIPLAAWVFYSLMWILLNPAFEWAAMALSSLTVMLNSRRLQKKKI
jgi:P-type Cu+ transporter